MGDGLPGCPGGCKRRIRFHAAKVRIDPQTRMGAIALGFFKGDSRKDEQIEELEAEVANLQKLLTPEVREAIIEQNTVDDLKEEIGELEERKSELEVQVKVLEERVEILDDLQLAQDTGLYSPRFEFADEEEFEGRLQFCREQQAKAIKEFDKKAQRTKLKSVMNESEGHRLINGTSRLLMRAYNMECDDIVRNVDTSNINESMERVRLAADAFDELASPLGVSLPRYYLELKFEEIQLSYEYKVLKGETEPPMTRADVPEDAGPASEDGGSGGDGPADASGD